MEEYNHRLQLERENNITQAYRIEMFHRMRRLPSLQKVLEDAKPKRSVGLPAKPQTDTDMLAAVQRLQAKFDRKEGKRHGRS